jgi:parvulin-like peptidyl-prolyl isomerase
MTEAELPQWATRPLRLNKFKHQTWELRLESYFLKRKSQLDQAVYKLLRHRDAALMQELYFRLQDGEQCFAQLAQEYSQGPEAKSGGEVGPVEFGQLPPPLATALIASTPGQLLGPVQVGDVLVIIQLERLIPARLDESMRERLLEEQFQDWLQSQVEQAMAV